MTLRRAGAVAVVNEKPQAGSLIRGEGGNLGAAC